MLQRLQKEFREKLTKLARRPRRSVAPPACRTSNASDATTLRPVVLCRRYRTDEAESSQVPRVEVEGRRMPDHDASGKCVRSCRQNSSAAQQVVLQLGKEDDVPPSAGDAQTHAVANPVRYRCEVHD